MTHLAVETAQEDVVEDTGIMPGKFAREMVVNSIMFKSVFTSLQYNWQINFQTQFV